MGKVSEAQARAARKWDAEHREKMRKSAAKSSAKRFILKLANEDELGEVQQWLAQRKENGGKEND
jgi:hypothetical protein